VIAVDLGAERAALCQKLGADVAVDAQVASLSGVVGDHTGGHGADVVIDTVGGALFEAARRFIAFEGRWSSSGLPVGRSRSCG